LRIDGVELFVEERGSGPPVLFSHGLLWSGRMYAPQIAALCSRYRCIAYDHRGQGRSETPPERTIEIETVYRDTVALIEALGIAPCHFVGLSMGGFVGMRLAARRPELVRSLVLLETAADAEPRQNLPKYRVLNAIARLGLLGAVAGRVAPIMFGQTFLRDTTRSAERRSYTRALAQNRRRIYRAVNGVLSRHGVEQELAAIRCPTLVVWSAEDRAIARTRAEALHRGIAGSELTILPRGGHSVTLEEPELVSEVLSRFLDRQPS
jgi:3-oxoadipate enol-lactonase